MAFSGSYYSIGPHPWLSSKIYEDQQEKYGQFYTVLSAVPIWFPGGGTDIDDQPGNLRVQRELRDVSGVGGIKGQAVLE
jgi:hypothetical protein